ncbi:universal stress protein [Streptomyces verrucosisporus]|uniref:universal stress protein n=1 Tax=Streptomyces verrucosisporus TaxID=1695161 RepID=UPI0019CFB818|nr:universal stress protein [Streptomyces verrucosisporus]
MNRSVQLPVVVGVDGSHHSLRALDRAVEEAVLRGAPLDVLCGASAHRLAPGGTPGAPGGAPGASDAAGETEAARTAGEEHRRALARQARRIAESAAERARESAPGLEVRPSAAEENAVAALVRAGRRAALTVVGTRGHGGFTGLLLGSVSLRVAAHTEGPVMVVRGDNERPRHTVVVGVEYGTDTGAARYGFEEAERRAAALLVLHAWELPVYPGVMVPPPTRVLEEIAEEQARYEESVPVDAVAGLREAYPNVDARAETVYAGPGHALVEASAAADLVVLAAHRRHRLFGMRLGPVTHAVLHHAHCPVVLVPTAA